MFQNKTAYIQKLLYQNKFDLNEKEPVGERVSILMVLQTHFDTAVKGNLQVAYNVLSVVKPEPNLLSVLLFTN